MALTSDQILQELVNTIVQDNIDLNGDGQGNIIDVVGLNQSLLPALKPRL